MACVNSKGVSSKKEKGRETEKKENFLWSAGWRKGRVSQTSAISTGTV